MPDQDRKPITPATVAFALLVALTTLASLWFAYGLFTGPQKGLDLDVDQRGGNWTVLDVTHVRENVPVLAHGIEVAIEEAQSSPDNQGGWGTGDQGEVREICGYLERELSGEFDEGCPSRFIYDGWVVTIVFDAP